MQITQISTSPLPAVVSVWHKRSQATETVPKWLQDQLSSYTTTDQTSTKHLCQGLVQVKIIKWLLMSIPEKTEHDQLEQHLFTFLFLFYFFDLLRHLLSQQQFRGTCFWPALQRSQDYFAGSESWAYQPALSPCTGLHLTVSTDEVSWVPPTPFAHSLRNKLV